VLAQRREQCTAWHKSRHFGRGELRKKEEGRGRGGRERQRARGRVNEREGEEGG